MRCRAHSAGHPPHRHLRRQRRHRAKALEGLDLTGIEIIGQAWGEVDIEKAAALQPDLIVSEYWPLSKDWSGGEAVTTALSEIAPVTGVAQKNSILTLIEDYEALARSLGADTATQQIAADKTRFETALADFKTALAEKPGLTALAVWAGPDALYVAAPEGAAELTDFVTWGSTSSRPKSRTTVAIGKR